MKIDNEFKNLIPALTADEYNELEKSILNEGCRDALVTWNGTLIDGHNRYEICTKHGLPYNTVERVFSCRDDVIEWIIRNQFGRRNLPAYERARLALRLKPVIAERAKERQLSTLKQNAVSQKSVERVKPIDTQKELAKVACVSHDTIAKIEKIEQKATDEIKAKLRNQEISINQAYQAIRREEKLQAVEKRIEEHKTVQTGVIDIYNTDKKYNIIYADPAWDYWSGGNKNQTLHYTTMTIDDICKLPVKDIANDDCVLFLWVTYPILQECFKVIEAWGFKYSTAGFVWVKKNKVSDTNFIGCGSWTRANSELCLIATRGQILRLDASVSQIIESPIEEHSRKPAVTRELITRLVGELPRIELFSRDTADGWDCWGNEA